MPQATPNPRPLGAAVLFQPNFAAEACRTWRILGSDVLSNRNSIGSTFALAAITSICDSRANTFMFAPGARHGPTPKGCALVAFPIQPPYERMAELGTS